MKFWHLVLICFFLLGSPQIAKAAIDKQEITNKHNLSVNNKFGIHIINPIESEVKDAAGLVNSSGGDWGYVTFVIQRNDRSPSKWQSLFALLGQEHLIPIVRIATEEERGSWVRPGEDEAKTWAEFLDNLPWPTKKRYVVVYNEPNQGKEWGNSVDPASYARVLEATINALKEKSADFFVTNSGFDQASPEKPPFYRDEAQFLREMDKAVPGIFNKLDGWATHSYPNPGFLGKPEERGRGTVRGYEWELDIVKSFGVDKEFSVFVTETGWQHAEGINYESLLPSSDRVGEYFRQAFSIWNSDERVVTVTPFVLNYPQFPFDHFSFKRKNSEFYPSYNLLVSLPKESGNPELVEKPTPSPQIEVAKHEESPIIIAFQKVLDFFRAI